MEIRQVNTEFHWKHRELRMRYYNTTSIIVAGLLIPLFTLYR
jgi:hypothetical protein